MAVSGAPLQDLTDFNLACSSLNVTEIARHLKIRPEAGIAIDKLWNEILYAVTGLAFKEHLACLLNNPAVSRHLPELNITHVMQGYILKALLDSKQFPLFFTVLEQPWVTQLASSFSHVCRAMEFAVAQKILQHPKMDLAENITELQQQSDVETIDTLVKSEQIPLLTALIKKNPTLIPTIFYQVISNYAPIFDNLIQELLPKAEISIQDLVLTNILFDKPLPKSLVDKLFDSVNERINPKTGNAILKKYFECKHENIAILEAMARYGYDFNNTNDQGEHGLAQALRARKFASAQFIASQLKSKPEDIGITKAITSFQVRPPVAKVTALQFDQAVEQFLKEYRLGKISDLFDTAKGPLLGFLPDIFLSNEIIASYLLHDIPALNAQGEPLYESKYERQVYDAMRTPYRFYRPEKPRSLIFVGGYNPETEFSLQSAIGSLHQQPAVITSVNEDIYSAIKIHCEHIRLAQSKVNDRGFGFLIQGVETGLRLVGTHPGHIQTFVSVIDHRRHRVSNIFFFDSSANQKQPYYKQRFVEHSVFSREAQYHDAAFNIQQAADDRNCSLYTFEFMTALVATLQSDAVQRMFEDIQDEAGWQAVKAQFFATIARALPHLFKETDKGYEARPWEELKPYFIQKRWEIGRSHIKERLEKAKQDLQAVSTFFTKPAPEGALPALQQARSASPRLAELARTKRKAEDEADERQRSPAPESYESKEEERERSQKQQKC